MPANTRIPGPLSGCPTGEPFQGPASAVVGPVGLRAPVYLDRTGASVETPPASVGPQQGGEVLIPALPSLSLASLQLNLAIVTAAIKEWERWNTPVKLTERQPAARTMVQAYWKVGVNRSYSDTQIGDKAWEDNHPWSAAFISYIMRVAGAGDQFAYASAHSIYIRWAIANRLKNRDLPFKAYRLNEAVPALGDLVGKARSGSGANYETIQKNDYKTHCDIVTEVKNSEIVTIGGNVGNSVSKTVVPLDKGGHISKAPYFVVIKVQGVVPFEIPGEGGTRIT